MKYFLFYLIFILGILIGFSVRFLLSKAQRRAENLNRYFLLDYAEKEIKELISFDNLKENVFTPRGVADLILNIGVIANRLSYYIQKLKELN